jgi:hypothetical protein
VVVSPWRPGVKGRTTDGRARVPGRPSDKPLATLDFAAKANTLESCL